MGPLITERLLHGTRRPESHLIRCSFSGSISPGASWQSLWRRSFAGGLFVGPQSCVVTHTHAHRHTHAHAHPTLGSPPPSAKPPFDQPTWSYRVFVLGLSVWIAFPPLLSPRIIQNRVLIVILAIVLVITILTAITLSVRRHWCICSSLINSDHGSFWVIKTKWSHESFSRADRAWMTLPLSHRCSAEVQIV